MAHIWTIFQILEANKIFPENPLLPHSCSYEFLAPSQYLKKTNDTIPKTNTQTDRATEGQIDLFYGPLVETVADPKWQLIIKSYVGYLEILVVKYNNTYHHSIGKKCYWCWLFFFVIETNLKVRKFKVADRVRIGKHKSISNNYTKHWAGEIFVIDFLLKTDHWTCRIKGSNREKVTANFYEKELLVEWVVIQTQIALIKVK